MRKIDGKYRQFSYEDLMAYAAIPEEYRSLVEDVYQQNEGEIPRDVLASMMEIISYPRFIRGYTSAAKQTSLEHGEARKLISKEILDFNFSKNLQDNMIKYNAVPYQIEPTHISLLIPEVDLYDNADPEYTVFRVSLAEAFGRTTMPIHIKRGSNQLFKECLYILTDQQPFTLNDVRISDKQLFQKIAIDAILRQATDIYIDPKSDHINISLAIFNEKVPLSRLSKNRTQIRNFINAIIEECGYNASKMDWAAEGGRKDLKMLNLGKLNNRYEGRVNVTVTPMENIVAPVIRVHDTTRSMQKFRDLRINPEPKSKLVDIFQNKNGIFIMAGPTGSGKTTTLYGGVDWLLENRPTDRLEEMSDPIELEIDQISQLKLDTEMNISFKGLSQSTTRRNAKIILLGEINSEESAEFAIDQAIKDLFIITTTHAGSASMIPARIKGLTLRNPFVYEQYLQLMKGVAHQKMLKAICPHCTEEVPTGEVGADNAEILRAYGYDKKTVLVERKDPECDICGGIGYLVNKPLVCLEVLPITDGDRERILYQNNGNIRLNIELILQEKEMSGINDAFRYLKRGQVTYDMVYRNYQLFNLDKEILLRLKRA